MRCRGDAELPAEEPVGRSAATHPPGMDALLMMRGAQDRQVLVIITPPVRTVDDVVRVQVAAGRAAGDPAAPAVALEDPVPPPPFGVALDVPGLFEGVDHPGDALPVVQITSLREPADPQRVVPESGDVVGGPEADARARARTRARTRLHLRSGVRLRRTQPGPGRLDADCAGRIERRRPPAASGMIALPASGLLKAGLDRRHLLPEPANGHPARPAAPVAP